VRHAMKSGRMNAEKCDVQRNFSGSVDWLIRTRESRDESSRSSNSEEDSAILVDSAHSAKHWIDQK
jgi:hypothetical protein